MQILGSFIHISDLHLGLMDPATGNAIVPSLVPMIRFKFFDGLWGHRARLLKILADFVADQRTKAAAGGYECRLLVTGDMTSFSHADQWTSADQFLGRALTLLSGMQWGLRDAYWASRAVSGNHDQWPGHPSPIGTHAAGSVPPMLARFRRDLATVDDPPLTLGEDVTVRFIRIDTDRDIGPHSGERLKAWGSFVSQLDDAERHFSHLLDKPGEIRVLLLHHSRQHHSWRLRMDEVSQKRLDAFLFRHRIHVVLCGHCHKVAISERSIWTLNDPSTPHKVLDAQCGTTTRRDEWPPHLHILRVLLGRPEPNTLLVHTIEMADDGRVCWRVHEHGPNPAQPGVLFARRWSYPPWPL